MHRRTFIADTIKITISINAIDYREVIRNYRKMLKIRQKDLAQKLGVAEGTLRNWELKRTAMPIDMIYKIKEIMKG